MATKQTKLSAVNIVLSNIGQAAVTTVDNDNPMVVMAVNTLDEVSDSVQSDGWVFNKEYGYPFTPDNNNRIVIPNNVLALDSDYTSDQDLVIREGFLYDKRAHSFTFTQQMNLNVVWLVDFDDMPEAFKNYVTMRAANLFAGRAVGSKEAVKFGEREEAQARAAMLEYETQQGDYNMLGTADNRNFRTYRPSFAALRY